VPIKRIADFEALSQSPDILDHFRRELDGIWCFKITARSAASLFSYEPPVDWSAVDLPVLVLIGEGDDMVSARFTEEVLAKGKPPNTELCILPGMGHLIFHDHLAEVLPPMVGWLNEVLALVPATAGPSR
jgi:pimeloyl-ACP methyl ester carboxylesterase